MGAHTPTAASAVSPISAMFPTYMRSTMEYSTFMNCAAIAGTASFMTVEKTFLLPRSKAFIALCLNAHYDSNLKFFCQHFQGGPFSGFRIFSGQKAGRRSE